MANLVDQLRAAVTGRVQGVSFRYYTRREANILGLTGWIRNEYDGSVLVVAEGSKHQLEKLLTYLHKGPPSAIVDHVITEWSQSPPVYKDFEIRWL